MLGQRQASQWAFLLFSLQEAHDTTTQRKLPLFGVVILLVRELSLRDRVGIGYSRSPGADLGGQWRRVVNPTPLPPGNSSASAVP